MTKEKLLAPFLIVFLLASTAVHSGHVGWKWLGPSGGFIRELIPVPSNPAVWLAINNGALFISKEYGSSWKPASLSCVNDIAVHPQTSKIYAVSCTRLLYVSTDLGKTFEFVSVAPETNLSLNSNRPGEVYSYGIHMNVSYNDGKKWFRAEHPIDVNKPYGRYNGKPCTIDYFLYQDIVISPDDPDELLVSGGPVYSCSHSFNGALDPFLMTTRDFSKWKIVTRRKFEDAFRFHQDSRLPGQLWINQSGNLYMFQKGTLHFLSQPLYITLSSVPGYPKQLFGIVNIEGKQTISRSMDEGRTWQKFRDQASYTLSFLQVADCPSLLLMGASTHRGGMYRWDAKAPGWVDANKGFPGVSLEVESAGDYVYATANFLYRKHGNSDWVNLSLSPFNQISRSEVSILRVNPSNPSQVFFQGRFLNQSDDAGNTWRAVSSDAWEILGFDPHDPNVFYLKSGGFDYRVYKSRIDSFDPHPLNATINFPVRSVQVHPLNSQLIFFSTGGATYRSTDGGNTVQELKVRGKRVINVAFRGSPNGIYVNTYWQRIYKTDDGTNYTFIPVQESIGNLINCDLEGKRLITFAPGEILESTDFAKTWHSITLDLPFKRGDISDPSAGPLYVSTSNGVYKEIRTPDR